MARAAVPLVAGLGAAAAAVLLLWGGGARAPPARGAPAGPAGVARMGCGGCHALADASAHGGIGPDLDARLPSHTAASLRAQILNPTQSAGFATMPTDFGERMSRAELDALVAYLLAAAR